MEATKRQTFGHVFAECLWFYELKWQSPAWTLAVASKGPDIRGSIKKVFKFVSLAHVFLASSSTSCCYCHNILHWHPNSALSSLHWRQRASESTRIPSLHLDFSDKLNSEASSLMNELLHVFHLSSVDCHHCTLQTLYKSIW